MWKEVHLTPEVQKPLPRSGTAGVCLNGNQLVLFGGNACSSGENFLCDTFAYDIDRQTFRELSVSGDVPRRMDRHTAVEYKNEMWIFGGDRGWTLTDKLWKFNLDFCMWTYLSQIAGYRAEGAEPPAQDTTAAVDSTPRPRRGHTAVRSNARKSMIIFAGMAQGHPPYYQENRFVMSNYSVNDTWELLFEPRADTSPEATYPCWYHFEIFTAKPSPRRGHSSLLLEPSPSSSSSSELQSKTRIYVFGGYCEAAGEMEFDSNGNPVSVDRGIWFNDLWRFLPEEKDKGLPASWEQIECWGDVPTPRVGHSTAACGETSFLIFGGATAPDANENSLFQCYENGLWRRIDPVVGFDPPIPLSYATAISVQDSLFIFGGCDNDRELNTLYVLQSEVHRYNPRTLFHFLSEFVLEHNVPYEVHPLPPSPEPSSSGMGASAAVSTKAVDEDAEMDDSMVIQLQHRQ